ncbi:MAG: hypothetical protein ACKODX_19515, partial [Gemmata sp.]
MQLFCPGCRAAFAGSQRCPQCGGLLHLPHEATGDELSRPSLPTNPPTQPSPPAARVAVGVVFALGLYIGLRKLAIGIVLAARTDPDAWWLSFEGLTAVYLLQGVTVIFGSVLAAAGRSGGFGFGAAVGAVCGALFLGAEIAA